MQSKGAHILHIIAILCAATSVDGSSLVLNFAQAASSAKSAGFLPNNSSRASTQFFGTILNRSFSAIIQCAEGDFGVKKSEIIRSSSSDDGCSYGAWILFWFLFGISLILVLLSCCIGFGFGRNCCDCCGKPCAPACGGNAPTVTYSHLWVGANFVMYVALLGVVLFLTTLGYLSTIIANESATRFAETLPASFNYLTELRGSVALQVLGLSSTVANPLFSANKRLDGLNAVNISSIALDKSLMRLDTLVKDLQIFVEGCDVSTKSCNSSDSQSDSVVWNKCDNGFHIYSQGVPALLSTGKPNPACNDLSGTFTSCPCCYNCSIARAHILSTRSMIPLNWKMLDLSISKIDLKQCIESAASHADSPFRELQQSIRFANNSAYSWYSSLSNSVDLRVGLSFAIWLPGWIMVAFAIFGSILGSCKGAIIVMNSPITEPGGIGHCLHWVAFVIGVLWVSFITLPLFAATSLLSVPLSDLCELVPNSGGDSSNLRAILSRAPAVEGSALRDLYLNDALQNCLLALNGNFMNSTNTGLLISNAFNPLRVANRVSNTTMTELLSARTQTASFLRAHGIIIPRDSKDTCPYIRSNPACSI
jgi:hypothetical protein